MTEYAYIRRNAEAICGRAAHAATAAGITMPTIVAVTKSGTVEEAVALAGTGLLNDFAENRTAMFCERQDAMREAGFVPRFHLIGQLQTNKVKYVVGRTTLIQSLDNPRLAEEIEKKSAAAGIITECLAEVNSGRETAKGGLMPEETEGFLHSMAAYSHIRVRGLMTMAPLSDNPEDSRPYFRATRRLFEEMAAAGLLGDDPILSMGMSHSFEVAIEEGSTMIRIGRAFFIQS